MRTGHGPAPQAGWVIDRRTFLKALGLGGIGVIAAGGLGARLVPLVTPVNAQVSPIDDLALQLRFDPERIFRFVADEIHYQPYAGILRGAEGTRLARAGNSADQASLLAALLTASGVQVRFVEGALDAAQEERLRSAMTLDAESVSQRTLEALVEVRPDGTLPPLPELDVETQQLVARALASGDEALSWARDQVLETVDLLESALASAGVTLPAPATALPGLEVDRHIWIQMASGPAWIDLDPSIPSGATGEAIATVAATTDDLPDDLRHRIDFRVVAETVAGGQLIETTLLEGFENADDLVGVPIGFLNIEQEGLKSLGVDISTALAGGRQYLPCLVAGENVLVGPGAIRFGGSGGAADEVFGAPSADPARSLEGEPTAEWLEITISSPGADPVTVRREVFDRIGPAARREGAVPSSLSPAELVSLEPGAPPDFVPAQTSHWLSVESAVVPASRITGLGASTEASGQLTVPVQVYHAVRSAGSAALTEELGGHWFADAPNIVSLTVTQELVDGQLALRPILDIWHRSLGRTPASVGSMPGSPLSGGVLAHVSERIIAGDADPAADPTTRLPSVGAVFEAARSSGVGIHTLVQPADVADLPLPDDTKARVAMALESGYLVVVPERPVTVGGIERTGWWRIDPITGSAADELDDGRGGTVMGDLALQLWNLVKASPAFHRLGLCVGLTFLLVAGAWVAVGGVYVAATSSGGVGAAGGAIVALGGGMGGGSGGIGFAIYCA